MTLQFPTTQEITHIVRNRVVDPSMFIGRQFCPIVPEYVLDIQYDVLYPSFGMTKPHQIGTEPSTINVPVMDTKRFGTAYWKETYRINEQELLYARQAGSYNQRAGRDLVAQRSIHMDTRLETRLEWLTWQAVINGTLNIDDNGVQYAVDYKIPDSNKKDISAVTGQKWSDTKNSDPIADINDWILLYRGTGAKPRKAYFNASVAKLLSTNANFRELLKRYNVQLTGLSNVAEGLKILIPNLEFEMYDEGYLDESKNFQLFIPDNQFIIIGDYPGEKMMDFVSTITLHNGGVGNPQPGKFALIEDKSQAEKNPHLDLTVGIYGLPRMFHPNWIVTAKVA
ncbi:major capsid protein [Aneurinibacillus sp. Ricciae_BoGa-3]|uniref:major capsid protein n=1 Tax=Aneurinibacillus sp. Ricciae_BoGa-3 TaxID=3022697 RepID=UPI002341F028|nr:major capsid protein [Aneurinibacillus sp. Ricciae_BoGa-3]WCK53843.1 major capsid protein [Aneurinibacillus sp. Ricciae_BoGa-3]